ncbi:response regulator transcription factor [Amycolatopsis decaplanina]|nr:response regulator transcription factor [Amycolatopsis decaplanina]
MNETHTAAITACAAGSPDVVLMDVRMPGLSGIAATRRILADVAGDLLFAPVVTRRLIETFVRHRTPIRGSGPPRARLGMLTDRECEILRLVGTGVTNGEIARLLTITEGTVKTHLSRVMTKLDLSSRAQAVVMAYETGLVVPGAIATR